MIGEDGSEGPERPTARPHVPHRAAHRGRTHGRARGRATPAGTPCRVTVGVLVLGLTATTAGCGMAGVAAHSTDIAAPAESECVTIFNRSGAPALVRTLLAHAGPHPHAVASVSESTITTADCVVTVADPATGQAARFTQTGPDTFEQSWTGRSSQLGFRAADWNSTVNTDGTLTLVGPK
jgi:hypothetical protein